MQLQRDFMKKKNEFMLRTGNPSQSFDVKTPKVGVREVVE